LSRHGEVGFAIVDDLRSSKLFAALSASSLLGVFAVPLLLKPYAWGKAFGWREEPETDVGLFFGRCLGAVATAGCVQGFRAARDPVRHRSYFGFAETASWLLAAVHVRGALEGRQPPVETAEVAMWSAMAIIARRFTPPA
jgi:hypothetical protein